MADYELNSANQNLNYTNAGSFATGKEFFKNGGTAGGNSYPRVDMSLWDQATMCGVCHVGGAFYEHDRNGNRLPDLMWSDMMAGKTTPLTSTVWENFGADGSDQSFVTNTPWYMPWFDNGNPFTGNAVIARLPDGTPNGKVPADMKGFEPNSQRTIDLKAGQLMMPNVKEMDCLFCHLKGYDNVMASVMTQAGNLAMGPQVGAGLMDMFPGPTFQGYKNVAFSTPFNPGDGSSMQFANLSGAMVAKILAKPSDNNCMQCHASRSLKDFAEMFNVTATASGFLSSAPMVYDPAFGQGPLGRRMVSYDCNAPFLYPNQASPSITASNFQGYILPGVGGYLQANGPTPFNNNLASGAMGGGNMGMTGPLYYYPVGTPLGAVVDQNTLKKSTTPFARAEWFKRGDAWAVGQDVHVSLGCGGCHYTGNSTDKNQCDPGRGFDMASTIEDGIPRLKSHAPMNDDGSITNTGNAAELGKVLKAHDTRNTVKRCDFCHITHTDNNGTPLDSFGAPDPTSAHAQYGLKAKIVQIVDKKADHGGYGGKGIARLTNFTSQEKGAGPAGTILGRGDHLDVMDCTVCHIKKETCVVRSLDATSGMRFPSVLGSDPFKGMLGLFEDPTGGLNPAYGGVLKEWKPIHVWQALGNMQEPLSTPAFGVPELNPNPDFAFRRKIYLSNPITAILWNNEGKDIDANGDGAKGGLLIGDDPATGVAYTDGRTKDTLVGWRDLFSGDVPNPNNTSGYDLPIFDPWIQRDLKAKMNFGPGPLSVISVGIGPLAPTNPYSSLYGPDGMFVPGSPWKYASIWSGAVVFTEPDQITEYKRLGGAKYKDTTLTFVGGPFMITHGVKNVATYVKGKACADCHAKDAGFFNGNFNMVGTAIPTAQSYAPGQYVKSPVGSDPADSLLDINPVTGDPVRNAGPGNPIPNDNGNMMMRPLEAIRVKAEPGDIRGYMEAFNKLGQPREINLVKHTTGTHRNVANTADVPYDYIHDVSRAEVLYPSEDGKIYYKINEISEAGKPVSGAKALDGTEWADYLEGLTVENVTASFSATDNGIGVNPVAVIQTIADADAVTNGVQVVKGATVALAANKAQVVAGKEVGTSNYVWTYTDGTTEPNGKTGSLAGMQIKIFPMLTGRTGNFVFTTLGTKSVTLTVTDEEGKTAYATTLVSVVAPIITVTPTDRKSVV